MKKTTAISKFVKASLAFSLLTVAAASNAAMWDFSPSNLGGGYPEGRYDPLTVDELTVTAFSPGSGVTAFVYLDIAPPKGGLGVCDGGTVGTSGCGSDDNLQGDEYLTFSLSSGTFTSVFLHGTVGDNGHGDFGDKSVFIDATGGGTFVALTAASAGVIDLAALGVTDTFSIKSDTGNQTYVASVSSVPLPAAAWLFGSALLGLASVARRKASQ